MFIETSTDSRIVSDFDFTFVGGHTMTIVIDKEAGDTIHWGDTVIIAHIVPKPQIGNPKELTQAEDVTVFVNHILAVQSRQREVIPMSPEVEYEWNKTIEQLSKLIN